MPAHAGQKFRLRSGRWILSVLLAMPVLFHSEKIAAQVPVWSQFSNSPSGTTRNDDVFFINATTGWSARGIDGLYGTTNGGHTWSKIYTNGPAVAHFRCLGFASDTRGWAGNLGIGSYDGNVNDPNILYETFDGGKNWSPVPNINESGIKGLCALHVLDSQHVYGGGRVRGPAWFAKTEDGGTSWFLTNLTAAGVMGGIMDVYFKDPLNGFVVGMDTNSFNACVAPYYHGAIARTTNGGLSWSVVANTPVNCSYFWKMSWPTPEIGYATLQQNASYDTVIFYKTTDGGTTWSSNGIPLSTIGASSFFLQGIGFVSATEGWLGGSTTLNPPFSFIHTTDGGLTWTPEGYNNTRAINRIRFITPTLGFASGQKLHVYRIPLTIASQPTNQNVISGSDASFNVTAHGTAPLNYQWLRSGTNLPGLTNELLLLTNVQSSDAGDYAVVVSDYSGAITSAVATLVVDGILTPPEITSQPKDQLVAAGETAAFSVEATGAAPLHYQWRFNETNLPDATNRIFTRVNVQSADAGEYSVIVTNISGSRTSAVATLTVHAPAILFADDFDGFTSPSVVTGATSTNGYRIFYRAASGPQDFRAIFGFDYSTVTYPTNIPPSPHSSGTTKGLFLTVNKDGIAAAAAVNLYPTNQIFSGNFVLNFDLWINWADLNTSTEHALFGINHSGTVTNRIGQSPSDGLFFAMEGEDDSLPTSPTIRDFAVFHGGGGGAPVLMTTENTLFGPAPLLGPQFENNNPGFVALFPPKTIPGYGTTPAGTAGLGWIRVEVRQINDLITWKLNDTIVAQYTNLYGFTNGNILIGYNDHFNSIGDSNNFAVFDNIRVERFDPLPVTLFAPQIADDEFTFHFDAEPYESYTVEWTTNLAAPHWIEHTNYLGPAGSFEVTAPLIPWTQRYFRVIRP